MRLPTAGAAPDRYRAPGFAPQRALFPHSIVSVQYRQEMGADVAIIDWRCHDDRVTPAKRVVEEVHVVVNGAASVRRAVLARQARLDRQLADAQESHLPVLALERDQGVLQENVTVAVFSRGSRDAKYVHWDT
jgi:hypothetical protein